MSEQASRQPTDTAAVAHARPPFWRDVRVLSIGGQVLFVLLVALVAGTLYANVTSEMQRLNMSGSYDFMGSNAGFEIAETPIPYSPTDSYWRAFQVGVINTIIVSIWGIVLATIIGIVMGVAQLSGNWLLAQLARAYVAIFRNIPLLLQLLFWFFGIVPLLPVVREAIALPGPIYISRRGIVMIGPEFTATTGTWLLFLLAGVVVAGVVWFALLRLQDRTGRHTPRFWIALAIVLAAGALGWLLLTPQPLALTVPVFEQFNFQGGIELSPAYAALLAGLVVYTGAFIAENVRAGIQGVSKGQKEAARALGLSGAQSMQLIILPQALRIIIPPTTSQYLNLAKNSSLAIAIGFPDLFNVARTITNQTGQTVQLIGLIMASYLIISLTTSLLMNIYNRSVRLVER
jgi:general L-amino acid transport system permease protein